MADTMSSTAVILPDQSWRALYRRSSVLELARAKIRFALLRNGLAMKCVPSRWRIESTLDDSLDSHGKRQSAMRLLEHCDNAMGLTFRVYTAVPEPPSMSIDLCRTLIDSDHGVHISISYKWRGIIMKSAGERTRAAFARAAHFVKDLSAQSLRIGRWLLR